MNLESRREVEAYLERLNRASPVATRQIARWGPTGDDSLRIHAVLMPERFAEFGAFLGESQTSFAIDVLARAEAPVNTPYTVAVVLSGAIRIQGRCGDHRVPAGQGLIVNPSEAEHRTWLEAGTHMVEFALPRAPMLSLGAELAPGNLTGLPHFDPVLSPALSQRLLVAAQEAARCIPAQGQGGDGLFRRWIELLGLTLLHEQSIQNAVGSRLAKAEAPPAALRRALDFIEAHAATDIMLADIARAASVSVSSLGRLFNKHLGQSPAALLRDLRLDRVREELRRGSSSGESIRELALRWGFQSPSQFSQAYQRRFGEKPSDARSRG